MRTVALVICLLLLLSCGPSREERTTVVRICPDGTLIGWDPETKTYWFQKDNGWTRYTGNLTPETTPKDFC